MDDTTGDETLSVGAANKSTKQPDYEVFQLNPEWDKELDNDYKKIAPPKEQILNLEDAITKFQSYRLPTRSELDTIQVSISLAICDILDFYNQCLAHAPKLQPPEGHHGEELRICKWPVKHRDSSARENQSKRLLNRVENRCRDDNMHAWMPACYQKELNAQGTVGFCLRNPRPTVRRTRTLYLCTTNDHPAFGRSWNVRHGKISADNYEMRQIFKRDGSSGHAYVVSFCEGVMSIYDPSFSEIWTGAHEAGLRAPRLSRIPMLATANYLYLALRDEKGRSGVVKTIELGGGGNTTGDCVPMSLAWIEAYVAWYLGVPDAKEPELRGVVPVSK